MSIGDQVRKTKTWKNCPGNPSLHLLHPSAYIILGLTTLSISEVMVNDINTIVRELGRTLSTLPTTLKP